MHEGGREMEKEGGKVEILLGRSRGRRIRASFLRTVIRPHRATKVRKRPVGSSVLLGTLSWKHDH